MAIIPSSPVKKAKYKHSTPRRRNRIWAYYSTGIKARAVAVKENVDERHVRGVIQRFTSQDYGKSRPGRGRPPKLNERNKRLILREVAKDPFIQIESLRKAVAPHMSRRTLTRYLQSQGIGHHLAATRPFLTQDHAAGRYAFAIEHADKDESFWRTVLFTDESTIDRGGSWTEAMGISSQRFVFTRTFEMTSHL